MILTCPNCGTQYVVKDGAIPAQGRQVRCAACKHSWHQDPEAASDADPAAESEPAAGLGPAPEPEQSIAQDEESIAEATLIEPRSGPEAEERAFEEALVEEEAVAGDELPVDAAEVPVRGPALPESDEQHLAVDPAVQDWREPPQAEIADDDFSPFPRREDEVAPKRGGKLTRLLAIVLVVAALAAAFWFLAPPEWKARVGLAGDGTSPLALVTTHMDRQRLESGNELLTVTGRVINPTDRDQQVPPLRAELRTRTGEVVYRWTISPPARSLPPGASASFNSAEVNVPPGGDELTITLGAPGA